MIFGGHAANPVNVISVGDYSRSLGRFSGRQRFPSLAFAIIRQVDAIKGATNFFNAVIVTFASIATKDVQPAIIHDSAEARNAFGQGWKIGVNPGLGIARSGCGTARQDNKAGTKGNVEFWNG
jgi:hypothetical protein